MDDTLTTRDVNLAVVLCSSLTREYMVNYARSLIYSTAMPFPTLASIRTAYELMDRGFTDSVGSFSVLASQSPKLFPKSLNSSY